LAFWILSQIEKPSADKGIPEPPGRRERPFWQGRFFDFNVYSSTQSRPVGDVRVTQVRLQSRTWQATTREASWIRTVRGKTAGTHGGTFQ